MSFGGNGGPVHAVYEALAALAFEDAARHVSETIEVTSVATGDTYRGKRGFLEFNRGWAAAFPDRRFTALEIVGSDGRLTVEYAMEGTHTGPLVTPRGHIPATGMDVEVRFCDVVDIRGGAVESIHSYFDTLTLLRQLGLAAGTPLHAADRRAPLELYAQTVDGNAPHRHKAIVHRFLQEVFNRQNAGATADTCSPKYCWHGGTLGEARGLQAYQAVLNSIFEGLPDFEVQILDTVAEGDKVVVRLSLAGTHLGPFQGIPPTAKQVAGGATSIYRIEDDRIVEEWWQGDLLVLLHQLAPARSSVRQSG